MLRHAYTGIIIVYSRYRHLATILIRNILLTMLFRVQNYGVVFLNIFTPKDIAVLGLHTFCGYSMSRILINLSSLTLDFWGPFDFIEVVCKNTCNFLWKTIILILNIWKSDALYVCNCMFDALKIFKQFPF